MFWKRKDVKLEDTYARLDGGVGLIATPIKMQCFPLYSILKAIEKTNFEYLSLDIEGTEYSVLNSAFKNNHDFALRNAQINAFFLCGGFPSTINF